MYAANDSNAVFIGREVKSSSYKSFEYTRSKSLVESTQSFVSDDLACTVYKAVIAACRADYYTSILKTFHLQALLDYVQWIN